MLRVRRLDQIEANHPAGGWRRWANVPIEDWPDHALESRIAEGMAALVGSAATMAVAAQTALNATYMLLDGVERVRMASAN